MTFTRSTGRRFEKKIAEESCSHKRDCQHCCLGFDLSVLHPEFDKIIMAGARRKGAVEMRKCRGGQAPSSGETIVNKSNTGKLMPGLEWRGWCGGSGVAATWRRRAAGVMVRGGFLFYLFPFKFQTAKCWKIQKAITAEDMPIHAKTATSTYTDYLLV